MIKILIATISLSLLLFSGRSLAGANDGILDEVTIRMISDDNLPVDVSEIALPKIDKDPKSRRMKIEKKINGHAAQANSNASGAAENAAENASNASENASSNAAEALSNAPGQNK